MKKDTLDDPCDSCQRLIGDHTFREMATCHPGGDHHLPYEDLPDGLTWMEVESHLVDQISILSAVMDTALGRLPTLIFKFSSTDGLILPDIAFVGPERVMRETSTLVLNSTAAAVRASKGK